MINNKILITGGTGSFGYTAVEHFLQRGVQNIIIYSRDEYKQHLMRNQFNDERLQFVIGDVRDKERLLEATRHVDIIIHAAAMKHIDICEQNPGEAYKTNVQGSRNVTEAALHNNVSLSINLSADKAVYPAGVYGRTKADSERIFLDANTQALIQGKPSRFVSLRYSNVLGSRGSVVEIFEEKLNRGETISVLNENMIRLIVTQPQIIALVQYTMQHAVGGETFLIESPVLKISDLAYAMKEKIGKGNVEIKQELREGEKYDATLLSGDESQRTIVSPENYLIIFPKNGLLPREAFTAMHGSTLFQKGEYGTHNARYATQKEVITMIYGTPSEKPQTEAQQRQKQSESKKQYEQHEPLKEQLKRHPSKDDSTSNELITEKPALEGGTPVRDTFLPYATQWIGEEEKREILSVLDSGWLTTGPKVKQFEDDFARYVGAKYAIALNSGTAALHCCVGALDIKPGDEVITTPFTFLATANVIVYMGATPVLVDIDPVTCNINPTEIRKKITPRTKAIIPVHYGGQPCNMDEINNIAKEHNLAVIEDAAHALSAEYKKKRIGALSDMAIFSFHPVKNITTAEGGMITTNDEHLAKLCVMHRTHGITKEAMEKYGKNADWGYDMQRLGHRYNMTEFQAALGVAQLKKLDRFQNRREEIVAQYDTAFADLPLILPQVSPDVKNAWHLYYIRIKPGTLRVDRNHIIKALKAENLGVNVHYIPIHLHSYYHKNYGFKKGDFPQSEGVYDTIITLPLFPKMTERDVQDVIEGVRKVIIYYQLRN